MLAVVGLVAVTIGAKGKITPEYLVGQLEEDRDCRAEIASVSVNLFSLPAKIELTGLKMVPRDAMAAAEVPLAERPPLELGHTGIECESAVLEADLLDLLGQKLSLRELVLKNVTVNAKLKRGGNVSLRRMFRSREALKEGAVPGPTGDGQEKGGNEKVPKEATPKKDEKTRKKDRKESQKAEEDKEAEKDKNKNKKLQEHFNVSELPLQSELKVARIENGTVNLFVEKAGGYVRLENLNLKVSDISIDPDDLTKGNSADIELTGTLGVDSEGRNLRYASLLLDAKGRMIPFEEATGDFNPDISCDAALDTGSYVDSVPVLDRLGKNVDKLKKLGIEIEELAMKETLQTPATLSVGYFDNVVRFRKEAGLDFNSFRLALKEESWIDSASNRHEFFGNLLASKPLTDKVKAGVDKYIKENTNDALAELAHEVVIAPVLKDGRLSLDFKSTGDLGKPKVKVLNVVQSLGDALKNRILKGGGKDGEKKSGVGDLIKGLFE